MALKDVLKSARKAAGYTQQELADILCVTGQAVSRWETGIALPDITQVPAICSIFGISADVLLGIDEAKKQAHIADVLKRTDPTVPRSREELTAAVRALREERKSYPEETQLLNRLSELIDALLECTEDDEDPAERRALIGEALILNKLMIRRAEDEDRRLSLIAGRCGLLNMNGQREEAIALAMTLPEQAVSRWTVLSDILPDEEALPIVSKSLASAVSDLFLVISRYIALAKGSDPKTVLSFLNPLNDLFAAAESLPESRRQIPAVFRLLTLLSAAKANAAAGNAEAAISCCEQAAALCEAMPLEEKSDSIRRSENAELLLRHMDTPIFDDLRDNARFLAVKAQLCAFV